MISEITNRALSAIPDDVKQLAKDSWDKAKNIAKKIYSLVMSNKSATFFYLSTIFAYNMAPLAAFGYMKYFGYSVLDLTLQGMATGATILALSNMIGLKEIGESANDRINYLAGVANILNTLVNPTEGLFSSIMITGLITSKNIYNAVFDFKDKLLLNILVEK